MTERLSELQVAILQYVLRCYEHVEAHGNEFWRHEVGYWGIDWKPFGNDSSSATERAAMSRALRRLEARGLVQRRNRCTGDRYQERENFERPSTTRTLQVKFTDEGRQLAERLTKDVTEVVNRGDG